MSRRDFCTVSGLLKVGAMGCLEDGMSARVVGGLEAETVGSCGVGSTLGREELARGAASSGLCVVVLVEGVVAWWMRARAGRVGLQDGRVVCSSGRARALASAERGNILSSAGWVTACEVLSWG